MPKKIGESSLETKQFDDVPYVEQSIGAPSVPTDKGMKEKHLKKAEQAGGRMGPSSPFLVSKKVTD